MITNTVYRIYRPSFEHIFHLHNHKLLLILWLLFSLYQSSTDETKCSQTSDEGIKRSQVQCQRQPGTLPETKGDEQLSEDDSDSGSRTTLPGNIIILCLENTIKLVVISELKRKKECAQCIFFL